MKIALNTQALETGYRIQGIGNYVRHLAEGLERRDDGHEYVIYQADKPPDNTDIVHLPYFSPYQRVFPFRKLAPKVVVTIHDLIPIVFPEFFPGGTKGSINWYLQKYLLKGNIDSVICDSESTRRDVLELLHIAQEETSVVYLAADDKFRPLYTDQRKLKRELREKYGLPEEYALYVGDVLWTKNLPSLIEAVKEINVSLVLVGKRFTDKTADLSNPWNRSLKEIRSMTAGDERFFPLGYVEDEDLIKLYNTAAVLCQPSHYEGFGLTVLEAMQSGCPVVVSGEGSLPEVAGDAGVYVDAGDPRDIADGIGEIYFNPEKYRKYRDLGLKQAKKFSWERTLAETVQVYTKTVSDKL